MEARPHGSRPSATECSRSRRRCSCSRSASRSSGVKPSAARCSTSGLPISRTRRASSSIGIIWINHHHTASGLMRRVDRPFLFLNLLLLLVVAFLPFPTKLVADYLQKPGERDAALAYATRLLSDGGDLHHLVALRARKPAPDRATMSPISRCARRPRVRPRRDRIRDRGGPRLREPARAVLVTLALAVFYLPSAALFDRGGEPL